MLSHHPLTPLFAAFVLLFPILSQAAFTSHRVKELYNQGIKEYRESFPQKRPAFFAKNQDQVFQQWIDHYNPTLGKFSQRYIANDFYYRENGPIILYINGEDEMSSWALEGQVAELAEQTGGFLVALEHRYFGRSLPFQEFTTENMEYLTTDQALKDTARFIQNFKGTPKTQINPSARWIVVGGSYAGNLAAWMRVTYPNLVFAAYASSAPIRAKLDFFEYDMAVHDGLPPACSAALANATAYIDDILIRNRKSSMSKKQLKTLFGLGDVENDVSFAGALTDLPSLIVQYGNPLLHGKQWLSTLCDSVTSGAPSREQIVKGWGDTQKKWMIAAKTNITKEFIDTTPDTSPTAGRGWYWIICNEFGYWQTSPKNSPTPLRSRLITLESDLDSCPLVFPGGPKEGNVESLNAKYLDRSQTTNRLLHVNGELDPWRRLSVSAPDHHSLESDQASSPRYIVPLGSHCKDLGTSQAADSTELRSIRQSIINDFRRWLDESNA